MRILADENVPRILVDWLRRASHDVRWIAEDSVGVDDASILARSMREERILITQDLDFGTLIFRDGHRAYGVVLFRAHSGSPDELLAVVRNFWPAIERHAVGHFCLLTERGMRLHRLPSAGDA